MNNTKAEGKTCSVLRCNVIEMNGRQGHCPTTESVLLSVRRSSAEFISTQPKPPQEIPRSFSPVIRSQSEGSLLMSKRRKSDEVKITSEAPMKVIVDVDAGVDDAVALLLLLAADNQKTIKILAITCTNGNTSVNNVCVNVLRLLGTVGRFDIPVFKGAEEPLITRDNRCEDKLEHFHGHDGFGDLVFTYTPSPRLVQPESAVSALNRITSDEKNSGKVTLVCLAPLTNIALAMKTYSQFAYNLKEIYVMGGNSTGMGNITSSGEFNFFNDPEAAHILLAGACCPIFLLPWETCLGCEITFDWRFNVMGAVQNSHMDLLNAVEKKVWEKSDCTMWIPCDVLLAAVLLQPDIVTKSKKYHASVELHGTHTRGQVVLDHLRVKDPNVTLIEAIDVSVLKQMLLWAAGHPNSGYHFRKWNEVT